MTKHLSVIENICVKKSRFSLLASQPEYQHQNPSGYVTGMKILKTYQRKIKIKINYHSAKWMQHNSKTELPSIFLSIFPFSF